MTTTNNGIETLGESLFYAGAAATLGAELIAQIVESVESGSYEISATHVAKDALMVAGISNRDSSRIVACVTLAALEHAAE